MFEVDVLLLISKVRLANAVLCIQRDTICITLTVINTIDWRLQFNIGHHQVPNSSCMWSFTADCKPCFASWIESWRQWWWFRYVIACLGQVIMKHPVFILLIDNCLVNTRSSIHFVWSLLFHFFEWFPFYMFQS